MEAEKKTLVMGVSPGSNRYANMAVRSLKRNGHEVLAIGKARGYESGVEILQGKTKPKLDQVHTITLYMNADNQKDYESYILSLNPQRIIFNPGAENERLKEKAEKNNIETVYGCTLVMLNTGQF